VRVKARGSFSRLFGVALSACAGDESIDALPTPVIAIYGPSEETSLVPFPSNRLTAPDPSTRTGLRLDIRADTTGDVLIVNYASIAQRFNELDGFSTSGGFALGFTGALDGSTFAGPQGGKKDRDIDVQAFVARDTPLLLLDIDERSPERGRAIPILPRYYAQPNDGYYEDEFSVVARPLVPLAPKRTYLFAATKALHGADGLSVARSQGTKDFLSDLDSSAYGREVDRGLDVLEASLGVSRDEVVVVSTFTTGSVTDELFALAERVRGEAPPATALPWEMETPPADPDHRVRFRAQFVASEYRSREGTFVIEDGVPKPQSAASIEVFLAFSDASISGPRPVVIFQHGLGGDKDGCWGTAERLSELGVAVIAIDSPEHGFRGEASGDMLSSVLGFFGIDRDTLAFDLGKVRDNFRQMAMDQLELVRFMRSQGGLDLLPIGAPDGIADLDVSQFLYIGHSFGSVQGPTIFALAPEIRHAVWNVGGDVSIARRWNQT
jgi:hypothetical protein